MANFGTEDPRGPGGKGASANLYGVGVQDRADSFQVRGDVDLSFCEFKPTLGRFVAADDVLQIQLVSSATPTINLQYRLLLPDGTVLVSQDALVVSASRTPQTFSRQLAEGVLMSVALVPSLTQPSSAYVFGQISLRRLVSGVGNIHEMLSAGYLTQNSPLGWPGHSMQRATDGAGILRSITGTTPAAGSNISETVPANTRWRLLTIRASLTTAVAVANRQVNLGMHDGVNVFYESPLCPVQAASLTWEYLFSQTGFAPVNVLNDVDAQYDNSMILGPGFVIFSEVANLQAADQWTAPQYVVLEWADGV